MSIFKQYADYFRHPRETSSKNSKEIYIANNVSNFYSFQDWNFRKRELYRQLTPTYLIERISNQFVKENNICNASAIHVRHTDLQTLLTSMQLQPTSDEDFDRFISSRPSGERVFLMTDDYHTQDLYLEKYAEKIIIFKNLRVENASSLSLGKCQGFGERCTSIAHTAVEMLIAAHAREFQGSLLSSLSDTVRIWRNASSRFQIC
jgi:hypothetical protein